ncbi:hypothetical protein T492DRAFT_854975 [Pavlovales sp. CCMP2436]|nr:hypothetical protein T492DRAFT_854975 [Pavlovales sp. CCMP2436]
MARAKSHSDSGGDSDTSAHAREPPVGGLLATAHAVVKLQGALRVVTARLATVERENVALSREADSLRRREKELSYAALKLERELAALRVDAQEARATVALLSESADFAPSTPALTPESSTRPVRSALRRPSPTSRRSAVGSYPDSYTPRSEQRGGAFCR